MHHLTDKTVYTMAFVTPVVECWLDKKIVQWVHLLLHHDTNMYNHSYMVLDI